MSSILSNHYDENEHPSSADVPANPSHFSHRIQSLDVLRGLAVLGAMFTSIWLFGGFSDNQQDGLITQAKGGNYKLFGFVDILLDGKTTALISIVFGASMLSYLFRSKQKSELYNADFFIRRQMWLIAFGLINAFVFLWSGDLLFHLGIMGVLLFPFIRLSARGLLIAAIVTTLIYSGKNLWRYSDDDKVYKKYLAVMAAEKKIKKDSLAKAKSIAIKSLEKDSSKKPQTDTLTKKQKEEKQAWEGLVKNMKYDPKKDEEKNKAMRDTSYGTIWNNQMQGTQWKEAAWTYQEGIWSIGSMIFLGMALFRFGFFEPRFSSKKYLLLALIGLAIGLLSGWLRLHYNHIALQDYQKYISRYPLPWHILLPFEVAFMALGYTSFVLLLIKQGFLKPVWKGLAVAGQMALTNYLVQSIICSMFFTGFGMGYFGRLQQWHLYVFACEIILINIIFGVLWLRHFNYGPAEWLLRCLIYKKWLPNRRNIYNAEPVIAVS